MDFIIRLAEEFFKKHKRLARYRRIFAFLAAVVVFATTYELILPAITMDRQLAFRSPGVQVGVVNDQRKGIEFTEDDSFAADSAGEDAFEAGFPEEGDFFEDDTGVAGDGYAEDFSSDGTGSADDWMQAENPGAGDTWENADEIVPGADSAGDDYSGSDEAGSLTDADGTGVNASAGDDLAGVPSDSSDPENSGADISVPENAENDNTDESTDLTDGNGTDSEEAGLEGTGSASHEDGQDLETADGEDSEDASDVSSENISGDNTQDASTGASTADSKETDEATDKNSNKSDTASGSTTAGSTTAGSGEAVIEGGTAETAVEFAQDGAAAGATDLAALDATGQAAAAITYPATIIYEGKDYTVTATFDEKAKLPAEVTLSAVEILPNKVYKDENGNPLYADYEEYYQKTLEALEKEKRLDDDQTVKSARFFDITFLDKEGKAVEPAAPVSIAVKYKDALSAVDTADTMAVHFEGNKAGNSADANEDGSEDNTEVIDDKDSGNNNENKAKAPADITVPEILDTKTEVKKKTIQEISFEAEKFSVYGVIGTELVTEVVLPGDNDTYVVTVTAPAEAGIPSGSTLRVVPFDEGSEEYDYARYSVLADKKEKGEQVDLDNFNLAAMDISIIGPDGNEIEPKAAVSVNIKIKNLPGVEDLDEIEDTIEIQHHVEAEGGVVIEKVFDGKAEGTYEMNTKEKIVSEGTVVDPGAVNEDDFREEQDASSFNLDAPAEDQADSEEEGIDINFGTSMFSTFTVTWSSGSASNTTANLRWRSGSGYNATTYGQVTLHYVDQNGTPITRPSSITGNINETNYTGNNVNQTYNIGQNYGLGITGYTYQGAHYDTATGSDITAIQLYREYGGTRYIRLNNGSTQVSQLTANGGYNTPTTHVYLVYSGSTTSNSVTVHYVDGSGNDLPIANSASTYTDLDSNSSSPAYLIYDINGYDYSYCYKKTDNTNTNIRPRLQKSNNVWKYAA